MARYVIQLRRFTADMLMLPPPREERYMRMALALRRYAI